MATGITPPLLQGPTAKEKKYDRQLRLWAASGQQALEDAHVLLLNNGPGVVGVETLKNLVLPGIGNFTIVDESIVTEEDLGVNFFLAEESLGRSRADESCRFLRELNPEVNGNAVTDSVASFVERRPPLLLQSTLIFCVGPAHNFELLRKLSGLTESNAIPIFYIHSVGFYSQFSLHLPKVFPIVDTHPDPTSTQDLRLLNPWPELMEYVDSKTNNLEDLNDHDHAHVPYLLLLLHYLNKWLVSHEQKPPSTYKEKTAFRELVREGARQNNAEGGEENFDEAVGAVLKSLNPALLSSGLREVFEAEECKNLRFDSANFWLIANTIYSFRNHHGVLPLPGSLPDMKAQSKDYIALQNIYKSKARHDLDEVLDSVRSLEHQVGRKQPPIESKEVEAFCKGAAFVKLVDGKSLEAAPSHPLSKSPQWSGKEKYLAQQLQDEESLLALHISFLVYDKYWELELKEQDGPVNLESFPEKSKGYVNDLLGSISTAVGADNFDIDIASSRIEGIMKELARANGAELHNISALTGGMVAQEAIKVLTKQYVPVDNICVFDGIQSKTGVYRI